LICCAALFFSLPAQGQTKPETVSDFSAPVGKGVKATYFDLIDSVFPKTGENTRKSVPLNNIFGDYQARVYEGNLQIDYARSIWVNYNGRRHLLLLINVGGDGAAEMFSWQEMNVLALFDLKDGLKLIDAADVQGDRLTFFSEQQPVLNISPQTDAFLIANHHFNAGESFMNLTLVSVVKNRFKVVLGSIPTLKAENGCALNYEEKAALQINPDARKTYRDITVDYKYVRNPGDEECGRKARGYTKNYRYRYVWNEKRREYVKLKYVKLKGRK
jgi:hypothetical protein